MTRTDPHQVTRDFERALCQYTGAPYAVAVTSCTMALTLAVAWHLRSQRMQYRATVVFDRGTEEHTGAMTLSPKRDIEIPSRTYVSVPMAIIHAGGRPVFRDEKWCGCYQLKPLPVWDSARWFSGDMYTPGAMVCVSFHWSKTLAIGQGGAILHDDKDADAWLRRARFDGRTECVAPRDDNINMVGWHCYMSPRDAAEGLSRLAVLPEHNEPLPNDDYPDLSKMEIFR